MEKFSDSDVIPTPASPSDQERGLSSMPHVVELADGLTLIADRLHERILHEILGYQGRTMLDSEQAAVRSLMDDELLLRQRAQAMYADAAGFVLQGLEQPQHRLMAFTTVAAEQIRRIGVIGEVTGLIGGVLALAGAVASGRLSDVANALEKIQLHHSTLDALEPGDPASS